MGLGAWVRERERGETERTLRTKRMRCVLGFFFPFKKSEIVPFIVCFNFFFFKHVFSPIQTDSGLFRLILA